LFVSLGVVDVAPELGVLDDELLLVLGGVAGGVELDDDAPGVDDEELDAEPLGDADVDGGVVVDDDDVDGDGVTVGGVVVLVVDDSRLQPATPRTSPVQSNVINALFISISDGLWDVPRGI
jgi:hypothetical protein